GGAREHAPPCHLAAGGRGELDGRDGIGELVPETLVKVGDELGPGQAGAGLGGTELDGGPHGLGIVGVGGEGLRSAVGQHGVDEGTEAAAGHGIASAIWAAWRRARCWRTLAFPTLMSMAWAASRSEQDCRNRSSRIRRYLSGSAARMWAARWGASVSGGGSSRWGRSPSTSMVVTSRPNRRRQCEARTVLAVARREER